MNKNEFATIRLTHGEINLYDFGAVRLHAYKTNDPLSDEVFIVEKNGRAVVIESPCFRDNIAELNDYLTDMPVDGVLVAYHGAGATFLPGAPRYATANAVAYSKNGGGRALIDGFTAAFGDGFDGSVHEVANVIEAGSVTIGGMTFRIVQTAEAFDVEIPEIGVVYTHMLGHDCHSIVAGAEGNRGGLRGRGAIQGGGRKALSGVWRPELFGHDGGLLLCRVMSIISLRRGG